MFNYQYSTAYMYSCTVQQVDPHFERPTENARAQSAKRYWNSLLYGTYSVMETNSELMKSDIYRAAGALCP